MTRQDKAQLISDLTEKLKETDHFYIADTSGLTVAQINKFREMCFNKGVEYKLVKNTLIKKALENVDGDYSSLDEVLKGTSGIMFVNETANAPAKIIKEFKKADSNDRPKFKAASIDSDLFIGEDQLGALASLKSKQELIGDIVTLLQSPAKNVLTLLQSGEHKLAGIVKTLSEREN
ncbi:LSU ribosomal protein L10P [Ekhidna lutea]|uniref:Large ribosomal subunit protein uL10 n=1 Tax=Ekhidna lutea TaxID=447679 RepID=A0A239JAP7_EKHLU|nr:50S ribosomal protein L10 [Ekhidna lutea]SNT02957.1 LSU ribosomal protein L10P [Ekhidna lutea]